MGYGIIIGESSLEAQVIAASSYAALPASPDNTIGVITATAIPSYHFTDSRPAGRPSGEVRITLVGRGTNAMQIASNPIVSVYPLSVYQTNGTTWTLMEAYLRSGGAWKRIRTYFYQDGALGLITSLVGYKTGSASYAVNADNFRVDLTSGTTSGIARVCPGQTIEIANVDTLKVTYTRVKSGTEGAHTARFVLDTTQITAQGTGVAYADLPASSVGNTVSLNVSALTGLLYMNTIISKATYYETDYIRVTEIWGE